MPDVTVPDVTVLDAPVFTGLVRQYGPELRLYCARLCGGRQDVADEVLQAAFSVAWARRQTFTGGNARAWLYCIARQQGLYRLRSEGRYVELAPERLQRLVTERPDRGGADPERLGRMKAAVAELEPVDQAIVQMAYGLRPGPAALGMERRPTYEEIAKVIEVEHGRAMSADGVRMRLKRALARMLRCMSKETAS